MATPRNHRRGSAALLPTRPASIPERGRPLSFPLCVAYFDPLLPRSTKRHFERLLRLGAANASDGTRQDEKKPAVAKAKPVVKKKPAPARSTKRPKMRTAPAFWQGMASYFGHDDVEPTIPESAAAGWDRAFTAVRIERGLEKPRQPSGKQSTAADWDTIFAKMRSQYNGLS
jgi:hypothetical protein